MHDSTTDNRLAAAHGSCAEAAPADDHHHPGCPWLVNYALGKLPAGQALAVATHLALCPHCRGAIAKIEGAAGQLLETVPPKPVSSKCLVSLLARLGSCERMHAPATPPHPADTPDDGVLPPVLRRLVGPAVNDLAWRPVMAGLDQVRLAIGQGRERVRLLRLMPGVAMPAHAHSGAELTVVLAGGFEDEAGRYRRGDFVAAAADHHHSPIVTGTTPCISLAVTEGPMRPDSLFYRIFNSVLRF